MSAAEYWFAVFSILFGASTKANLASPILITVMSLGFAYHKGVVLGYGWCPAMHVFLTGMMSCLVSYLLLGWYHYAKDPDSSVTGPAATGCLFKIIFGVAIIFVGPFFIYAWAGNITMDISSKCEKMYRDDLKDYIDIEPLPPE